ncbi:hypothetical protein ACFXTH_022650 [Malus domestica]
MALMVMKRSITKTVRGGIPVCEKVKDFLEVVGAKFKVSENAKMGNLMTTLTSLKFNRKTSVRERILKFDGISRCHSMILLLSIWHSHHYLNENRLSKTKSGTVNLVNFNATKRPIVNIGKQTKPCTTSNVAANIASSSRGTQNYKGFSRRVSTSNEVFEVHVGNGNKVVVEAIGNLKLRLPSGFVLKLFYVLYVPSLTRSLVSASKLVRNGFAFIRDDESIRFTEGGQQKGPLALYLEECGIQAQYTTPGTLE